VQIEGWDIVKKALKSFQKILEWKKKISNKNPNALLIIYSWISQNREGQNTTSFLGSLLCLMYNSLSIFIFSFLGSKISNRFLFLLRSFSLFVLVCNFGPAKIPMSLFSVEIDSRFCWKHFLYLFDNNDLRRWRQSKIYTS
jgi:hypothetical protein